VGAAEQDQRGAVADDPARAREQALDPRQVVYHADMARERFRLPVGTRLARWAIKARLEALAPERACAGADPARLDAGGDVQVHRDERDGLRLALARDDYRHRGGSRAEAVDLGLDPDDPMAPTAGERDPVVRERGRECRLAGTTDVEVGADGTLRTFARSSWAFPDERPRPLRRDYRQARPPSVARRPPRRGPRRRQSHAARRAHRANAPPGDDAVGDAEDDHVALRGDDRVERPTTPPLDPAEVLAALANLSVAVMRATGHGLDALDLAGDLKDRVAVLEERIVADLRRAS
jgi:hypothetical protein